MVSRCKGTNASGSPCSAQPVGDDGHCYWHSPSTAAERAEGRRQGGRARSNRARAKKRMAAEALTPGEIQGYVAVALRGVLVGSITPGVANAVASLARAAVAVRAATELEERLAALEARAGVGNDRRVG
ncbi:MAG: hypothetical protein K0Q71_6111 [Thermomicrobiales bacterium]|nr:hypothetical protein [Thermomicrobiales bacterium]